MRVPLQWLADYVDLELPVEELANRLTMVGLKVEAIERIGQDWQDVIIGQVVALEPHPESRNPLWVAKVDLGERTITVVTGAPNLHLGDKAPVVLVGGLLPHGPEGGPVMIEAKSMAGITSEGMLASERELGISDEHSGIFILPPDLPAGAHLRTIMGDEVLDIETNPNRPDTLSIIGIAREVAAISEQQIRLPSLHEIDAPIEWLDEESFPVLVEDTELCPRYSALRIEGITQPPSPFWMRSRLEAAGMRSINLLVDTTNYVMLEYGQPMHAFDATRLRGGRIVVRRAQQGEQFRTLDGIDRTLSPENLVIADGERAVALAGIMGGEDSEITPETSAIVLESASFEGINVRRTAQSLGLRTESSSRFEKGLPPEQTVPVARRYLQLLAQITEAPMRVARITDVWIGPPPPRTVTMPMRDLERLVGISVSRERAAELLSLLGFEVVVEDDAIGALVPFWRRVDIERSADLVEEVARLIGYDAVPSTLMRRTMEPPEPLPGLYWEGIVRDRLMAAGVNEATTHSLTSTASMSRLFSPGSNGRGLDSSETWEQLVANSAGVYEHEALTLPVRLKNPATQDRQVLRLTLLPGLLDVIARNRKETDERLAFFEIDRTFFQRPEDLPYERRTLGLALCGHREPSTWQTPRPAEFSFFDLKGLLQAVLDVLQIEGWQVEARAHPSLHPGRAATVRLRGHDVAYVGELHPAVAAKFDIEGGRVQVAEMDLDTVFSLASDTRVFHPLPRYPAAHRDIAVVVEQEVPAGEVLRLVRQAGDDVLESARIFDVYQGEPLPADAKSIAVSLDFRAPGATLTQEEVGEIMERIVATLGRELGATLRE